MARWTAITPLIVEDCMGTKNIHGQRSIDICWVFKAWRIVGNWTSSSIILCKHKREATEGKNPSGEQIQNNNGDLHLNNSTQAKSNKMHRISVIKQSFAQCRRTHVARSVMQKSAMEKSPLNLYINVLASWVKTQDRLCRHSQLNWVMYLKVTCIDGVWMSPDIKDGRTITTIKVFMTKTSLDS